MISFRRPAPEQLERLLSEQVRAGFNYREVGATLGDPPKNYNADRYRQRLGQGEPVFLQAKIAIRQLEMWNFDWMELLPAAAPIAEGVVLATLTRQLGMWFFNACRIVYVLDEESSDGFHRRFGFAFGTLDGQARIP